MAKEFFYALDSHNLYKVNTSSDEVEWTASLEADVFSKIAVTPDGKSVFVNNHDQNKVFQVDASSGDLEAAIDVNRPLGLAASADNNSLWVSGESNEGGTREKPEKACRGALPAQPGRCKRVTSRGEGRRR